MKREAKITAIIIFIFIMIPLSLLIYLFLSEKFSAEITLLGPETVNVEVGDEYIEEGYIAKSKRKNMKDMVIVETDLDTKKVGTYEIDYTLLVRFLHLKKKATRTVNVVDTKNPTLKVTGDKEIHYLIGNNFVYPTYEAYDQYDGDLTNEVAVETDLDLSKKGTYEIKYRVEDSSGNSAEDSVTVIVDDKKNARIEISISKQKLTYYEEGAAVLTSDVVTGIHAGTPLGTYKVLKKVRNATLKGEDYETPVQYWIAFLGSSYGIHDAYWRTEFGGNIYLYNGSHGCVNMPLSKVRELYEMVEIGTPVYIFE